MKGSVQAAAAVVGECEIQKNTRKWEIWEIYTYKKGRGVNEVKD